MNISVIGHRDSKMSKYDATKVAEYYSQVLANQSYHLITCLTPGADMMLAQVAYAKGIDYSVYIPYRNFTSSFSTQTLTIYKNLIRSSHSVTKFDVKYTPSHLKKIYKEVIENSDKILFVWDGSPGVVKNYLAPAIKSSKVHSILNLLDYSVIKP